MTDQPLTKIETVAICEAVVKAVDAALDHQFRLPFQVLGQLVSCQTDAYRARFLATYAAINDDSLTAELNRYLRAAAKFQRALERRL
jgi:hypothetical protein